MSDEYDEDYYIPEDIWCACGGYDTWCDLCGYHGHDCTLEDE